MIAVRIDETGLAATRRAPDRSPLRHLLRTGAAPMSVYWPSPTGFCPGPTVPAVSMGLVPVFLFVAAMAAGMMLHDRVIAGMLPR